MPNFWPNMTPMLRSAHDGQQKQKSPIIISSYTSNWRAMQQRLLAKSSSYHRRTTPWSPPMIHLTINPSDISCN